MPTASDVGARASSWLPSSSEIGAAPVSHAVSSITYGASSTTNYGHIRASGYGTSSYYAVTAESTSSNTTLNSTTYLYFGTHMINVNSTMAGITGIDGLTATTVRATLCALPASNITGLAGSGQAVEQVLSIPALQRVYHRYCRVAGSEYGVWYPILDGSALGAAGGIATLNSDGKLSQMPTAADTGAIAESFRGVSLWNGSWSSGKITVENFTKYNLYKICFGGQSTAIFATRVLSAVRGWSGYSTATPDIFSYHFSASYSGNVLNWGVCNSMGHLVSSNHTASANFPVTDIYGII